MVCYEKMQVIYIVYLVSSEWGGGRESYKCLFGLIIVDGIHWCLFGIVSGEGELLFILLHLSREDMLFIWGVIIVDRFSLFGVSSLWIDMYVVYLRCHHCG